MSSTQQLLLGEGAGGSAPVYIEDVFSTYLYVGNGSTQTITNGIDLSTKGGLVWQKSRSDALAHVLSDTVSGTGVFLESNSSGSQSANANSITAFNTTGFSFGSLAKANTNAATYVSWTFREQPKFFDIVTFTTAGSNPNTGNISHNLGSTPGCVMVKRTDSAQDWKVYHIGLEYGGGLAINRLLQLNDTGTIQNSTNWINVSSTTISFPGGALDSGGTFVAYLFADDAGGFGLAGTDNVISCGSFSGLYGAFTTVNLGYEPQWIMWKAIDSGGGNWNILDTMRQWDNDGDAGKDATLFPNTSGSESTAEALGEPNATGFRIKMQNNDGGTGNYIYVAIRRGLMKVPTSGTSVFTPLLRTGTGALSTNGVTGIGFAPDLLFVGQRDGGGFWTPNRLTRFSNYGANFLFTSSVSQQSAVDTTTSGVMLDGTKTGTVTLTSGFNINQSTKLFIDYFMQRAPSFMDVVAYAGTGSNRTVTHNLAAVPELMIFKIRTSITDSWQVYCRSLSVSGDDYLIFSDTIAAQTNGSTRFTAAPTSTLINLETNGSVNGSGNTYVAYLFATCAGVSKIGSYTGTGATQTIDCGFTGGARFVLIKRTNLTGDWYVWDTVRGMVSGTDPALFFNSTAAEVNANSVYTIATGFQIVSTAAGINASGSNYIFLAIA